MDTTVGNREVETAVLGGGCFWCTEAVFKMLMGVLDVSPGYAGGNIENPTYEQVSSGTTGHAEVIKIDYDPNQISYRNILTVFFASHDPTQLNRQGNDEGTQYRSIIFYGNEEQKKQALFFKAELNKQKGDLPIVTEIKPLDYFYKAENYHEDYYSNHMSTPYCEIVISPKLEKVKKNFAKLLLEKAK